MYWGKLYKGYTLQDWQKVMWSDEYYVYLSDDWGWIFVMHHTDEVLRDECVVPTFKKSSVCVMVWGCVMKGQKGPLVALEFKGGRGGGMNSAQYWEQVLEAVLQPFYTEMKEKRGKVLFQQDSASCHTSKVTKKWLSNAGIHFLYHPASSPDFNPIEPVWHELKKCLHALPHLPNTVQQLRAAVLAAWDSLPIEDVDKHIITMPDCVQAVLAAKGGHTRF